MNEIVNMIRRLVAIRAETKKLELALVTAQDRRVPYQKLQRKYEGRAGDLGLRILLCLLSFFSFLFLSLTIPEALLPSMYCGGVGIWYLILSIRNSRKLNQALRSETDLLQRGTRILDKLIELQAEQNTLMDKIEATKDMI